VHEKKEKPFWKEKMFYRKKEEKKQVDVVLKELHLFADENVHEKKEVH